MNMIRKFHHLTIVAITLLAMFVSMVSCEHEDIVTNTPDEKEQEKKSDPIIPSDTEQTIFMYYPWSNNLTEYFKLNIADMESVIRKNVLTKERVIVFLSTTATNATLFELTKKDGKSVRNTLKTYTSPEFTKAEGITSILNDVKYYSPAEVYSMIIGAHGMGWIPVSGTTSRSGFPPVKKHWEYENVPPTRFFGGTDNKYQTNITTLAKGISDAGIKMEYILFDDCYMSTVEVAYDLKDVTGHLIGSTSEIMAFGMPYAEIGQYLIGKVNYKAICDGFYDFYSNYATPCGTIGVTDCSELNNLAAIMKEINATYTFDESLTNSVQKLDGYYPVIFFDYGDYVSKLCQSPELLTRFNEQLNRAIPFKRNTEYYYSMIAGGRQVKINTFSGITISDPSQSSAAASKTETGWYKATH